MRILAATLALLICAGIANAEDSAPTEKQRPNIVPPPPPESLTQGESVEPEVEIFERQWAVFEEYSVGGQVYAVRVVPAAGPPYFLYDSDGDGVLESRRDLLRDIPQTHQWKILTW